MSEATGIERTDAIVVLGCAVRHGRPSPALLRRVALAVRAYRAGLASRLIASGGKRWQGATEALVMRDLLLRELPEAEVIVELRSRTTAENALESAAILRALGGARALIATSAWHLPRALADFRRCGVDAIAPPSAWLETSSAPLSRRLREAGCAVLDATVLAMAGKMG